MSEALANAIRIIGSRKKLAMAIRVSVEVVKSWMNNGICVPLQYAFKIQILTQGQVTWQEISPELYHNTDWVSPSTSTVNVLPSLVTQISLSRIQLDSPMPMTSIDEIHFLSMDIKQRGLQRPIGLDSENRLIFGKKRFYAHQMLQKKTIAGWRISLVGVVEGHHNVTDLCKNFLWSERLAIAFLVEQLLGNRQGQRSDLELRQNFGEVVDLDDQPIAKGRTDTLIANHLGFGNRETYAQSKKIYLNACPALVHAVDTKRISISGACILLNLPHVQQKQVTGWQPSIIRSVLRHIKHNASLDQFDFTPSETCVP